LPSTKTSLDDEENENDDEISKLKSVTKSSVTKNARHQKSTVIGRHESFSSEKPLLSSIAKLKENAADI